MPRYVRGVLLGRSVLGGCFGFAPWGGVVGSPGSRVSLYDWFRWICECSLIVRYVLPIALGGSLQFTMVSHMCVVAVSCAPRFKVQLVRGSWVVLRLG